MADDRNDIVVMVYNSDQRTEYYRANHFVCLGNYLSPESTTTRESEK